MVEDNLTFWIIAWVTMGVAFVSAICAILFGAIGLDRQNHELAEDDDE